MKALENIKSVRNSPVYNIVFVIVALLLLESTSAGGFYGSNNENTVDYVNRVLVGTPADDQYTASSHYNNYEEERRPNFGRSLTRTLRSYFQQRPHRGRHGSNRLPSTSSQSYYDPLPLQFDYNPPQQSNNILPQSNYGPAPQSNYGPAPQSNYGPAPQSNYGPPAPQSNYGPAPQSNYGPAPQSNYGTAPQSNYGTAPQSNYGPAPQSNYGPPAPQSGGYGYGYANQTCLTAASSGTNISSYDDIPQGSILFDGHGMQFMRERLMDLPFNPQSPPEAFIVGTRATLPPGYMVKLREEVDIRVNPDGTTHMEKEVAHSPPDNLISSKSMHISQLGTFRLVSNLIVTPTISSPLNGSSNPHFMNGLDKKEKTLPKRHPNHVETQVEALLELFNNLNDLQGRENREAENNGDATNHQQSNQNSGFQDSNLATPTALMMVQRFTIPEPNTSETGLLDSAFNFGAQSNRMVFGDLEVITDGWKAAGGEPSIPLQLLGSSLEEAVEGFHSRVRKYMEWLRGLTSNLHYPPVEKTAYSAFTQFQFFFQIPSNPASCPNVPIDPNEEMGGMSMMNHMGRVNSNHPPPKNF